MRLTEAVTAADILTALIAISDAKIWATELALFSGSRRVDFWTLEPVLSKGFRASAFEIKVSRGDFLRDRDGKQDGALKWSDRFWYVTPPGLLTKADLPEWSGLQEWDGKSFRVVRKAPARSKAEPSWEFVASLIRNSGDVRRDIEFLKSQIAFYEMSAQRRRREDKTRNQFQMERWVRASDGRAAIRSASDGGAES